MFRALLYFLASVGVAAVGYLYVIHDEPIAAAVCLHAFVMMYIFVPFHLRERA